MFGDREQVKLLKELLHELRELRNELFPSKLTINFVIGDVKYMSSASVTLNPPQTVNGVVTETVNGQSVVPVPANLLWSVQDPTVVSFVTNPDGSATFTPLAVGVTQVGCSDSATGNSGVGNLTVTQGTVPGTLTITFSAPVAAVAKKV